jgi:hypothetical protein
MLLARPGAPINASVEDLPAGLVGTLGVRVVAFDGDEVIGRQVAGIVEVPALSGIYAATLTAPEEAGDYLLVWDTGGATPDFERQQLRVGAVPTLETIGWRPTVEQVATAIRSRTYQDGKPDSDPGDAILDGVVGGSQAGTFNDLTDPSDEEVEDHITDACADVLVPFASGVIPEASYTAARRAATLKAALAVELAKFRSSGGGERSPYLQLRIDADAAMTALVNTSQVRDLFA